MTETNDVQKNESDKKAIPILIAGIVAGALAICVCILIVVTLVIDPWGVISRIRGQYDPIASAVPEDVHVFVNVNLLQLQSKELFDLVNTFVDAAGEDTIADLQELMERIDEDMDTTISLAEDVQPWIGQFVGIGIKDITSANIVESGSSFYILAEVRNKKKADEFLVKLFNEIEENSEKVFIESSYEKTTIYTMDADDNDDSIAFARSGSLLLFSNGEAGIMEMIDAQKSMSLSDKQAYKKIVSPLPKDRLATVYLDLSFLEDMYQGIDLPVEVNTTSQFEGLEGLGMSVSIQDVGIQMDYVFAYDPELLSEEEREGFKIEPGGLTTSHLFPDDTLLYITSEGLGRSISALQDQAFIMYEDEDLEEAMTLYEEQFGFNPSTDLYPYIDGEWAIGIIGSETGLFPEQLGIPISFLVAVESSDQEGLLTAAEKIAAGLENAGGLPIEKTESHEIQIFKIMDNYSRSPVFIYAVKDNILLISTDIEAIESAYGDKLSLDQNTRFIEGWDHFPADMRPIAFLDLEKAIDLCLDIFADMLGDMATEELEGLDVLEPIKTIHIAMRVLDESLLHSRMIVIIE